VPIPPRRTGDSTAPGLFRVEILREILQEPQSALPLFIGVVLQHSAHHRLDAAGQIRASDTLASSGQIVAFGSAVARLSDSQQQATSNQPLYDLTDLASVQIESRRQLLERHARHGTNDPHDESFLAIDAGRLAEGDRCPVEAPRKVPHGLKK
jgi:hypothetical protein